MVSYRDLQVLVGFGFQQRGCLAAALQSWDRQVAAARLVFKPAVLDDTLSCRAMKMQAAAGCCTTFEIIASALRIKSCDKCLAIVQQMDEDSSKEYIVLLYFCMLGPTSAIIRKRPLELRSRYFAKCESETNLTKRTGNHANSFRLGGYRNELRKNLYQNSSISAGRPCIRKQLPALGRQKSTLQ